MVQVLLILTYQVLHLVVWSIVLQVCKINSFVTCPTYKMVVDGRESAVEHVPGFHIMLAGHQPRFQQILIKTITQSSD